MSVSNYKSVFDIIGPVMIGPSSSHTAGAVAIGKVGHDLFKSKPTSIKVHYYESFAQTHLGHGTDYAIISGILGFAPDDKRVPDAINIAKKQGIDIQFIEEKGDSPINHPNTAVIDLSDGKKEVQIAGCSIGGGTIEIRGINFNGYSLHPSGPLPILLVTPSDDSEQDKLVKRIGELSEINLQKTHFNEHGKALFEFDLNNRLRDEQLESLHKDTKELIYI